MSLDHASRLAVGWAADPAAEPCRVLDGSWVLADLTGFTRLTERLEGHGVEGAEMLHRVMNLCFTNLLGRGIELGGDIIGFAGDAALLRFSGAEHQLRAAETAVGMRARMAELPASITGGRRLRVSVGVLSGPVTAVLTRTEQRGLFLCGHTVSTLVQLEAAAEPGQVLAAAELVAELADGWSGASVGPGVELVRPRRFVGAGVISAPVDAWDRAGADGADSMLSPAVRELFAASSLAGDHRTVSVGFVRVGGLDALTAAGPEALTEVLEHVAATVVRVTRALGVSWLDIDVGVDAAKLLIASGAPQAVPGDEERLLTALRQIVDESAVPLRAGAQRGRVFAAPLGVPGRRTYTLMGDPTNVAARALGLAADRELIVGDGLRVTERAAATAVPLGEIPLKNRVRPMAMWRVDRFEQGAARASPPSPTAGAVRRDERDRIAHAWKATVDGAGSVMGVVGEPGAGVSELLADAADRAGLAATLVTADPFRQHEPYALVAALVLDLARVAGVVDSNQVDDVEGAWVWLSSFAAQLPEHLRPWIESALESVRQRSSDRDGDPRTTALRTRLVLGALIAAAAPRPWLAVIDDLDVADAASRAVLGEVSTAVIDQPVMVLTGGATTHAILADPFITTAVVTLEPLADDEATDLVLRIAPSLRDDQVDGIVAAAGGNAFVLAELARHPQTGELPDSLQRLGTVLIDALPVGVRALVRDAATFGSTWSLTTMAAVMDRPELADPATWARAGSVVQPVGGGAMAFRHEAYRRVAHDSLSFQRRRFLHGAIADHLARHGGDNDAGLARHYQEAARLGQALPLAMTAAQAAKAAGALVEAVDLLNRAVTMAKQVDRDLIGALLLEQAEALEWLGDLDGVARVCRAAQRQVRDQQQYARLCHRQADLALTKGRFRHAERWIERGLAATTALGGLAVTQHCWLLLDRAGVLHYRGRQRDSIAVAGLALEEARRADEPALQGLAHVYLEMAHSALLDEGAIAHGEAAIRIFTEIGHDRHLGIALTNSGLTAMSLGRWDTALDHYRRGAQLAARTGRRLDVAIDELNIGFVLFRRRQFDDADAHARRSLRTFATMQIESLSSYARLLRAMVAGEEGRQTDADELTAAARRGFADAGDVAMVADCDVVRMGHLLRGRQLGEVIALAADVRRVLGSAELPVVIGHARLLGCARALAGDPAGADMVVTALERARAHRLVHEEYLCLGALLELERAGVAVAPDAAATDREAIGSRLGIAQGTRW